MDHINECHAMLLGEGGHKFLARSREMSKVHLIAPSMNGVIPAALVLILRIKCVHQAEQDGCTGILWCERSVVLVQLFRAAVLPCCHEAIGVGWNNQSTPRDG
ncbi:hypothetical protein [Comamonas terrigena]|uniref:hypothetical protein n=1 Tax=Comamonas terrigena TaxID=32013 RepID=UPI00244B0652|nr:hypothetical protein [Comamonas terrigena]MDH1701729.1 hypothetical protein [Comamonas terrigena]